MARAPFLRAIREFGVIETARKMHQTKTIKFGVLQGIDSFGNRYYENREDYPHGQHRWVEFEGFRSFFSVDPSEVPAEWFSWLHGVTDTPPSENSVGNTAPPKQTVDGPHTPFKNNHGGVVADYTPNQTQARPRGFGVGNGLPDMHGIATHGNEERFYTQPGWAVDARHKHPRRDVGYTLMDTAEDVRRRRLEGAAVGSAAAIAEAAMAQIDSGGKATGPATFALPADSEEALAAAGEADKRDFFDDGAAGRDAEFLAGEVERLSDIVRKYESLAGFDGDADDALDEAREQLDVAQAMFDAASAAAAKN